MLPPKNAGRKRKYDEDNDHASSKITVRTQGGQVIPEVDKIRVLGEESRTATKLATTADAAMHLVTRVSNRKGGMKEENLTRLVQSFVISHIAYMAAFNNWRPSERAKIDAVTRKAYKMALGLLRS